MRSTAPPTTTRPRSNHVTLWDRLAVAVLGSLGFSLSYDALQQMAVAIHVRGPLTYAFPLVIDGFIAYGVRALLVLHNAPWTARAYTWTLFTAATAASVWANALHAVRLNQEAPPAAGLSLGDTVVGLLSAVAPIALAGAVHLYILIGRHAHTSTHEIPTDHSGPHDQPSGIPSTTGGPRTSQAISQANRPVGDPLGEPAADPWTGAPPESDPTNWTSQHQSLERTAEGEESAVHRPTGYSGAPGGGRTAGRPPGASLEDLLAIGRRAWRDTGRLSRTVVEDAVRAQGIPISSDRLTTVMDRLRAEQADTTSPKQHTPA